MWPYEADNHAPVWSRPDEKLETLKKRDDHLLEQVNDLKIQLGLYQTRLGTLESTVTRLTLFNVLYQFYFEGEFTHEETRRLVTMLNSPDEQDKNLAKELILKKIK